MCGEVTFKSQRRSFTSLIKKCYEHYFSCKVGDQDESWAPHFCCVTCARLPTAWAKGSRCMPFAIPMVWRELTHHVSDCYFCLTSITAVTTKSKHTVQFPNLPFAMRPVPHSAELPVPKPPTNMRLSDSESSDEDVGQTNNNTDYDPTFAGACSSNEQHLLTQGDLNDIVRDLKLSKKQAELLDCRLKGWNLLRQDTKMCFYHGRHEEFKDFFSQKDGVVFCNDVCSVMEVLGHEYNPDQWRLFTDSSKVSLKDVLLHNGNRFPSFPLAHAANMKESYESMKLLVGKIRYDEFKWKLCVDLKVVALLLRMQLGYIKYCCFLCKCDSWHKKNHCVNKLWPKWTSQMTGQKHDVNPPLVLPGKIYLPPLNIKLGLMKNFVKGMNKTGCGFKYVRNKFPNVTQKSRRV